MRPRRHLPRRSVLALVLSLIGVLFLVPSAAAHGGGHLQRFLALTTDPSNNATPSVAAVGPIHARGVDHVTGNNTDVFTFPKGSIRVFHKPVTMHDSFDPKTCLASHTETGNYWIKGGTRAYAHAYGHGHYFVKVYAFGCNPNAAPNPFSVTIKAAGPLTF
jgi:hypothetical protein